MTSSIACAEEGSKDTTPSTLRRGTDRSGWGWNARMITCESACPHRIPRENTASLATGLRWPQSPSRLVRRCSSTARKPSATPIPASTRRLPAIRTPSTTRSRPTPRWRCCACCEASAAAPTPTPAARSGWRSAPASRPPISSSPAWVRPAKSSSSPSPRTWARSTPSRQASSIGLRRSPGRSGARHACAAVNPDIDAKTHANISTGLRINKFGVALEDARGIYRDRRGAGLRFVGVHVHIGSQITSAEPLQRAAEALVGIAWSCATTACRSSTSIWRRPRHPYEGKPMIAPSNTRGAAGAAALRPARGARSRDGPSSAVPGHWCRASSIRSRTPTGGASRCSTPA